MDIYFYIPFSDTIVLPKTDFCDFEEIPESHNNGILSICIDIAAVTERIAENYIYIVRYKGRIYGARQRMQLSGGGIKGHQRYSIPNI